MRGMARRGLASARAAAAWHDAAAVTNQPRTIPCAAASRGDHARAGLPCAGTPSPIYMPRSSRSACSRSSAYFQTYLLNDEPRLAGRRCRGARSRRSTSPTSCWRCAWSRRSARSPTRSAGAPSTPFGFLWLGAGFMLYPLARTRAAARRVRAVLLGRRRGGRHHVRDGARGHARRGFARAHGRHRRFLPGTGRARVGADPGQRCRNSSSDAGVDELRRGPDHVVDRGGGHVRCPRRSCSRASNVARRASARRRCRSLRILRTVVGGSARESAHLVRLPAAVRIVRRSRRARHVPRRCGCSRHGSSAA